MRVCAIEARASWSGALMPVEEVDPEPKTHAIAQFVWARITAFEA